MIASTFDSSTGEITVEWTTDCPVAIDRAMNFVEAIQEAEYADEEPSIGSTKERTIIVFFLVPQLENDLEATLAAIDELAAKLLTTDTA